MMKRHLLTSVLLLTFIGVFGQNGHDKCGTDIVLQQQLQDPENRAKYDAFEEAVQRYTQNPNVAVHRENGVRIIPVVFHILHEGGNENIGMDKVMEQMEVLNTDYKRLNPDTVNTPHRFRATEESWFSFTSDDPADYVPYVANITGATAQVSHTKVDGVTLACGDSVQYYPSGSVDVALTGIIEELVDTVLTEGVGYVDGDYLNVPVTGGTGMGAFFNVSVVTGVVDSVYLVYGGNGYLTGDTLSADSVNIGGFGSGFSIVVDTVNGADVSFTIPVAWMDTVVTTDSLCGNVVLEEELLVANGAYYYVWVDGFVVDSTKVDTITGFDIAAIQSVCYEEYLNPSVSYSDRNSFIEVTSPQGGHFAFYFDSGLASFTPNPADPSAEVTTVNISSDPCSSTAQSIAQEFMDAVDALPDFTAILATVNGSPTVRVMSEYAGDSEDYVSSNLPGVQDSLYRHGSLLAADSDIEFRLATKDPLGNCTDGVVRVFTSKTNDANNNTGFKAESYWNSYSYLNIWVVKNIDVGSTDGTTLGYAQFPASGLLSTDGITVIASNIDVRDGGGRTSTHEVGHWLSLIHVWGDAICGSDNVLDTPIANTRNFGVCGNHPDDDPNLVGTSSAYFYEPYNLFGCDPDNPDGEMFCNYMDYSDDACQNMFTYGQKARMDFTLHGDASNAGIRSYLISQENLEGTGVADPYTPSECSPISAFYFDQSSNFATQKLICVGEDVSFEAAAYNGVVDNYNWTFEGGSPATDTQQNPEVTYNTPGVYDVSLEVSNTHGSDSHTEENMVVVSSATAEYQNSNGYADDFSNEQSFLDEYFVFNADGTENKWEWYSNGGSGHGATSVRMFNVNNMLDEIDELVSPSYDMSVADSPTLQFRYSGAAVDATPADELRIMVSRNCGKTWQSKAVYSEFELINSGLVSGNYVPNANSTWTAVSIDLGSYANEENVRVKFRWLSGERSNNFYIDDFTISNEIIGIVDLEHRIELNIAPNPTNGTTAVTMSLREASTVKLELVDVLGRDVKNLLTRDMGTGTHKFDVDLSSFNSGIYFLRISVDNNTVIKKVIKN